MADMERVQQELAALLPPAAVVTHREVAVLIPCFNEAATIQAVIAGFRRSLPAATIYVYDNNSSDGTALLAATAGAVVRREPQQGKGHVLRRMFADIDSDIYVLADGDLTYDASAAGRLIEALVEQNADMAVGVRIPVEGAYRPGHRFGNHFFNGLVRGLFGRGLTDILSGYRVVSRRFAKSFPAVSSGFEIETELSVHALDLRLAAIELPLAYGARAENSPSKLKTYRDGARILLTIAKLFKELKPVRFFGALSLMLAALSVLLGLPVIVTYAETGLVPRLPTAILSATVMQLAFLSLTCGIILDAVGAGRRELKRLRYLELPAPANETSPRRWSPRLVGTDADSAA